MSLLDAKPIYKPFHYPWAYDAWLTQQRIHWLPEEVPLADDVKDWRNKLTDSERHLLTQIFRFFTQADVEVNNCYMRHYSRVFKPTEVQMMLAAFSAMETVHVAAYSHLLDTIGMPETEYSVFLTVKEMKDKYDYMQGFNVDSKADIAKTLAVFGAFTEGLQLFASFAMLMNFPRFNKMKGMGQIVTWSVRDETLHCNSMVKLFRTFIQENPEIWTEELQREIYVACSTIVDHEDAFIDLAFELGGIEGMTADQREALHPLHRRPPPDPAQPAAHLPRGRQEPAAVDGPDAERHRAHQLLREPRDRILQGLDTRHLGRGVQLKAAGAP
jgi:ribonucleoside-diphosphate reductase beta chain